MNVVNRSKNNTLHRPTLALDFPYTSSSRSFYPHSHNLHMFFSLIWFGVSVGASYFHMAILCYEIPFLFFLPHRFGCSFYSVWTADFLRSVKCCVFFKFGNTTWCPIFSIKISLPTDCELHNFPLKRFVARQNAYINAAVVCSTVHLMPFMLLKYISGYWTLICFFLFLFGSL